MFKNSEKNHLNMTFTSKRNLEVNDKNGGNHRNNDWIQKSFVNHNNKRVKTDSHWTPFQSKSNDLMTTNPAVIPSQESVNMEDEDNDLNDGLDEIFSQMVDLSTQQTAGHSFNKSGNNSQSIDRTSDQNMTSQIMTTNVVKSDEDVSMNTITNPSNHSSNSSDETVVSEGRLKILESRNHKLNEEVRKYKKENIQSQHLMKAIEREKNNQINETIKKYESLITFERSERQYQTTLLIQMQSMLKQHSPNAPIVKSTAEYLTQRKRGSQQDFSQIKLQEFYAPLSVSSGLISTQNTPLSSGDVLVAETQPSILDEKRPKLSSSFPSQVSSTQILSFEPMDTYSGPSNVSESDSSQNVSQNQTQSSRIWFPIRAVLEHKFSSDQKQLNQLFCESHKEFDDQWIRDIPEINNWRTGLQQLIDEFGLNIQPLNI